MCTLVQFENMYFQKEIGGEHALVQFGFQKRLEPTVHVHLIVEASEHTFWKKAIEAGRRSQWVVQLQFIKRPCSLSEYLHFKKKSHRNRSAWCSRIVRKQAIVD